MDRKKKEKIAVFIFSIIFPLEECNTWEYWGGESRRLKELVSREWKIPFSNRNYICTAVFRRRTIITAIGSLLLIWMTTDWNWKKLIYLWRMSSWIIYFLLSNYGFF